MTPLTIIPVDVPEGAYIRWSDEFSAFAMRLSNGKDFQVDVPLLPGDPIPNMPGWVATGEVSVKQLGHVPLAEWQSQMKYQCRTDLAWEGESSDSLYRRGYVCDVQEQHPGLTPDSFVWLISREPQNESE